MKRQRVALALIALLLLAIFSLTRLFRIYEQTPADCTDGLLQSLASRGLLFHFIVSILPFDLKQRRAIESVLRHHPDACVVLHVRETLSLLPVQTAVLQLRSVNYCAFIRRYSLANALGSLMHSGDTVLERAAANFSSGVRKYARGPHWYSHQTDFMRLYLMYEFGGWYLDTDVIVVAKLDGIVNALGKQAPDGMSTHNEKVVYLNGCVMNFSKSNSFTKWALREFLILYNDKVWGANGPELLSDLAQRIDVCQYTFNNSCILNVLPTEAFQLIHFTNMSNALNALRMEFGNTTYAFHYNNKIVHDELERPSASRDTLRYQLFNDYCVLCSEEVL